MLKNDQVLDALLSPIHVQRVIVQVTDALAHDEMLIAWMLELPTPML
jgi:hypothetical protein